MRHPLKSAALAEADTGTSRLFYEFRARNQSGWMVLEAFSVSPGKASVYLRVIDLQHGHFRIGADNDARTRRKKLSLRIVTLEPALEETRALPFRAARDRRGRGSAGEQGCWGSRVDSRQVCLLPSNPR